MGVFRVFGGLEGQNELFLRVFGGQNGLLEPLYPSYKVNWPRLPSIGVFGLSNREIGHF